MLASCVEVLSTVVIIAFKEKVVDAWQIWQGCVCTDTLMRAVVLIATGFEWAET